MWRRFLYAFLVSLEGKNSIVFENRDFPIKRLSNSFACTFWNWSTEFIDVDSLPLFNFFFVLVGL